MTFQSPFYLHCKVVLYADDTALFVAGTDIEKTKQTLNDDLARAHEWLNANKLTLNVKKTKCMLFGTAQRLRLVTTPLHVEIGGSPLDQVEAFKYLGLNFDPCLNWKGQVVSSSALQG